MLHGCQGNPRKNWNLSSKSKKENEIYFIFHYKLSWLENLLWYVSPRFSFTYHNLWLYNKLNCWRSTSYIKKTTAFAWIPASVSDLIPHAEVEAVQLDESEGLDGGFLSQLLLSALKWESRPLDHMTHRSVRDALEVALQEDTVMCYFWDNDRYWWRRRRKRALHSWQRRNRSLFDEAEPNTILKDFKHLSRQTWLSWLLKDLSLKLLETKKVQLPFTYLHDLVDWESIHIVDIHTKELMKYVEFVCPLLLNINQH